MINDNTQNKFKYKEFHFIALYSKMGNIFMKIRSYLHT